VKEATGGASVVDALKKSGVTMIFELPGLHTLPIYDALYDEPGIRRIMVKHEGNASVMADVYGRLTREPGVVLVAAGPGATNSISGVAQARVACSPVLHVSGTVPTEAPPSALHGLDDPDYLRKLFEPVTKRSVRVMRVGDIGAAISRGYELARRPRMGPVHVELPYDILVGKTRLQPQPRPKTEKRETKGPLSRAKRLIERSSDPVIFAGKSVPREGATDKLVDLAERMRSPVVIHSYYPDAFPLDHELFAGDASEWGVDPIAEAALSGADLILAVGVQWGSAETAFLKRFLTKPCIMIDVDRGYPDLVAPATVTLTGDLKKILSVLHGSRSREGLGDRNALGRILELKERFLRGTDALIEERILAKPIYPGLLAAEIANNAGKGAILSLDGSSTSSWFLDVYARRQSCTLLWPGAYGSIGFAFPAGIAAQVVHPKSRVIVATGDGGFLMSYMDIATAMENELPLTVVVTNNQTYGDIWHIQRARYGGRYIGTELQHVDYARLAESFGGRGIRVEEPSQLGDACREALDSGRFTVLDVVTDPRSKFLSEEVAL
jgi:acetolactate synthase I/II/III large subunit